MLDKTYFAVHAPLLNVEVPMSPDCCFTCQKSGHLQDPLTSLGKGWGVLHASDRPVSTIDPSPSAGDRALASSPLSSLSTFDNAGNTLATARKMGVLSSLQTFNDYVGVTDDLNDFYRFTLTTTSSVQIDLTNLGADADMQLIQDLNGNGLIEVGEILAYPWQDGIKSETLTIGLTAGTYYIRVLPYSGNTTYTLSASATTFSLPTAYNLNYGYGMVDAAAAVAQAIARSPYPSVPDLGGNDWNLDAINAPEVWAAGYTGQGIVVAVIDTGVDYTHLDLDANIWVNTQEIAGNGIDDDGNGYIDDVRGWDFVDQDNNPMDLYGHGTHVAGTIAAENNGIGITGVAYNAKIMPVKVLGADGNGTTPDVAAGIRYAADNGADVINLSLGGNFFSTDIASAVEYATNRGAMVVMAAGNSASFQPGFPANLANQWGIAVGAVDNRNRVAPFSNGAGIPALNYVVAPGVGIYSTIPGNTYRQANGTSMATPHVAGVVALMLSANPTLTPAQITPLLTSSANPNAIRV